MWKVNFGNGRCIKLLLATITMGHCLVLCKGHVKAFSSSVATSLQSTQSQSTRHTLRQLSVDQGLSSSYVQDITQDQNGFLWIATSNGLNRYDGYRFETFTHQTNDSSSLGSNKIESLLIARDGTLWVGGLELNKFDAATQTFVRFAVSNDRAIWNIYEDRQGLLWFSGPRLGLRAFDPQTGKLVHHFVHNPANPRTIPSNDIYAISEDNRGNLWLAAEAGITMFSPKAQTFAQYALPSDLSQHQIRDLEVTSNGQVWTATSSGVTVFDPDEATWQHYRHLPEQPQSLTTDDTWSVYQDSQDNIWIGTGKQGLERFMPETQTFEHFPAKAENPSAIPSGSIVNIHEDDSGTLWLSIPNFGISQFKPNGSRFRLYRHNKQREDSLGFDNLQDLHESSDGTIWLATDGGGLDRFNPETEVFVHYRHDPENPNSLSSDAVIAIDEDSQGNFWVGTWAGGLNQFNVQTQTFKHYRHNPDQPNGLASDNITRVFIDNQDHIWLSTWGKGVQRFNPDTQTYVSFSPKLSKTGIKIANRYVNDIHQSSDGSMWLGGHDGLEKINPATGEVQQFEINRHNDIFDIYEDSQGLLWLATADGLVRFNSETKTFKTYGLEDGLPDLHIHSIERDKFNHLWLGTRYGLSQFNPQTEVVETYDLHDGLQGAEFSLFSHLSARDGTLYFGGPYGLNAFRPDIWRQNTHIPNVIIHGFELDQRPATIGEDAPLPADVTQLEEIQLSPQYRDITFEFTALNFTVPEHNRYRYRLMGLESDWTEVDSTQRRARYTNLSPGDYTFWVQGSNDDGIWNEEGDQLKLVILPSWWQTWWFRALGGIVTLASLQGIIYWRLRATRQRQQELEKIVQDKTKALAKAHSEVLDLNVDLERRVEKRTEQLQTEITERRQIQDKLLHMALHDSLTQLPNRAWLMDALQDVLENCATDNTDEFALLFLDGDRFKTINDSLGHPVGDQLLVAVAQRLRQTIPSKYPIARLGGDEFTILVQGGDPLICAQEVAQRITAAWRKPFHLQQQTVFFSASIGIVIGPCNYTKPEQILRDADIAMYRAKAKGKDKYLYFDTAMRQDAMEIMQIEQDLRSAIERQGLKVYYQPIISLQTDSIVGFEALLRWQHPVYGYVSPARFIPIAEETGQIHKLGLWVLQQACQQIASWRTELNLLQPSWISVNLSAKQLAQPDLVEHIDDILLEAKIPGSSLKLEITETGLMENIQTASQLLLKLKERKIRFAIDDFGTGYSSLSYLHQFPVQTLKIDRSFVQELESNGKAEIVQATIVLAHNLDLEVIAEGIETEYQKHALRKYGCELGQGYLFAKPLDAESATRYLQHRTLCT
ncbi:MAG: EAL domain-containing protein [Cyanobacteria bacterium P01_H01_bin.26]